MAVLNFAAETVFDANTTSGNMSLTQAQLQSLVDGNYTTGGVYLSGDNILALDVDLGNRIATKDMRYYFDSTASTAAVASGISFYYRDYTADPWSLLTTTYGAGYYTTTSGNFFPHQVRMIHTISGTSISGTLREYEVNSNEDIVDYGTDGTMTDKGLTNTPFSTSDPYTIPVYNDGDKSATAYVYIGNTGTDADDMLRISDAQAGTYLGVDDGPLIGGDGYMWGIGAYSYTTTVNNKLELSSLSTAEQFTLLETLPITPATGEKAVVRWSEESPWLSEVFYAQDSAWRRYSLEDDTDVVRDALPFGANPRDRFIYDPENDKIYAFDFNNSTTNFYQYDPVADSWTGSLGSFSNSPVTNYPCGSLAFIPSNVLNDGARSIIAMCGTGLYNVGPCSPVRIRLTDHNVNTGWGNLTGFTLWNGSVLDESGDNEPVMMLTYQGSNLDAFPAGCQGVLWAIQSNYRDIEVLNYFVIYEGDSNHRWHTHDLSTGTRVQTAYNRQDVWYPWNQDTFFYDETNNKVWYVEDPNWQDASRCVHWFSCDGLWQRGYNEMHVYTDLDPDGYMWLQASDVDKKRDYLDGKIYGGAIYMICYNADDDRNQMYLYTPGGGDNFYYQTGTYTTPILKNQDPTYWYIKAEIPENTQITTTSGVVAPTIEVRSSNTAPDAEDSHYLVMFAANPSDTSHIYPMGFDYDGNELWRDDSLGATHIYYNINNVSGFCAAANKFYPEGDTSYDVNSIAIWTIRRASDNDRIRVVIYNRDGGITYSRYVHTQTYSATDYWRPTNAVINANGNTYVTFRGFGAYDDRLSILTDTGWWIQNIDFTGDQSTLYSMCLAGEVLEDLWIIKEDENAIYRYSPNLTELMMIDSPTFQNANGICEDGAGGFWVGDYGDGSTWIRHYDQDGSHIATYDVTDHVQVVATLSQDYYGGVWLLDTWGDQVARFASSGTFIGKVALLNPRGLNSTPLGAYCMTTTYDDTYFIDMDVNLNKTVSHPANIYYTSDGGRWEGAQAASIDVSGYLDVNDAVSDPVWGTGGDLEWSEVGKDTHFLHHKLYHQARITLRSDSSDTPEVEKIALPPTVELTNIPMQGSKNTYLKTVVASGTVRSRQSGKLRTWFSVEE